MELTPDEVIEQWQPWLRLVVFGVPVLLYVVNALTLRIRLRVLACLMIGVTGLLRAWLLTAYALPQYDLALERAGRAEDTDGAILGAMLGAPIAGALGTLPVAVLHLLRKWLARRQGNSEST